MEHARHRVGLAAAAVPLVLVPALGSTQGGFQPDTWVWAGALAAWACALALVLSPAPGALRRAWPWVLATGAVLAWTLLSRVWSAHAAQTVLEARRTLVYAAVVLALVLLARRGGARTLVLATHAAIALLLVYALARYLLGHRHYDEFEQFLLTQPLGYANAVGILATLGLLLAAGIAASQAPSAWRTAAAATAPVLALALELSHSTASVLALGAGAAATALLAPAAVRYLATLALLAVPAALAVGLGAASRVSAVAEPRFPRPVLALAALGCAALAAAALRLVPLPPERATTRRLRRVVLAAVAVLALGGIAAAARSGSTEPRASYYHVAWHDQVAAHPLLGTGAGTFGLYWARSGKALELNGALDAHSLYLETLAELGPVGLLLLACMLLAPLRDLLRDRGLPLVAPAAGAYAAFLVHAGLDWDWEMPAVVVAALCCAAAVATARTEDERPLPPALRGIVLAAAAALGACAIAGARSHTEPSAETARAPHRGALVQTRA